MPLSSWESKDIFNVDEKATWRHMTTSWHVTSMDVWPAPPPLIAMSSTLVACWNNFNRYLCRYVYGWPTNKSQTSWISPIFTNTYKLFQHISTILKAVSTVSMCSPWTDPILPQISASRQSRFSLPSPKNDLAAMGDHLVSFTATSCLEVMELMDLMQVDIGGKIV